MFDDLLDILEDECVCNEPEGLAAHMDEFWGAEDDRDDDQCTFLEGLGL